MKVLSYFFVILFCWIIFPFKWTRKALFNINKRNAIERADLMSNELNKQVYVVQNQREFYVGTRTQFRSQNSKVRKQLAKYLDFDYRNAIIYQTK